MKGKPFIQGLGLLSTLGFCAARDCSWAMRGTCWPRLKAAMEG